MFPPREPLLLAAVGGGRRWLPWSRVPRVCPAEAPAKPAPPAQVDVSAYARETARAGKCTVCVRVELPPGSEDDPPVVDPRLLERGHKGGKTGDVRQALELDAFENRRAEERMGKVRDPARARLVRA